MIVWTLKFGGHTQGNIIPVQLQNELTPKKSPCEMAQHVGRREERQSTVALEKLTFVLMCAFMNPNPHPHV